MTYKNCKLIIAKKAYKSKEDMQEKLDAFLNFDRLNLVEYEELTGMLADEAVE